MNTCPYCQAEIHQMKAGRTKAGSQRYRCGQCQRRYTPNPKEHGYPTSLRQQAVKLYVEGMNYRRIGRLLGVDHVTVMLWVKAHADGLPNDITEPSQAGSLKWMNSIPLSARADTKKRSLCHDAGRPSH